MRVDVYLVKQGYAKSREAAQKSINARLVKIDGKTVAKSGEQIDDALPHEVDFQALIPYVSRGGLKLEAALKAFSIDPGGFRAVDIGASTGGFTDCLLQHGAREVVAVDSGHGQLASTLLSDGRVISLEGVNARTLTLADIGSACDIAVMDVSFISQTYILPQLPALLNEKGIAITLIKPQFEVGRGGVGKHGIVRHAEDRKSAVMRVIDFAESVGLYIAGLVPSPITGGDGNREFLALFSKQKSENVERILESIEY
jgi:23S rRNA (cytidine1920-2'-O)/16S rRNA (cytidine1409-2'-O)-methyltransferase